MRRTRTSVVYSQRRWWKDMGALNSTTTGVSARQSSADSMLCLCNPEIASTPKVYWTFVWQLRLWSLFAQCAEREAAPAALGRYRGSRASARHPAPDPCARNGD